jgi:hypothetical protein
MTLHIATVNAKTRESWRIEVLRLAERQVQQTYWFCTWPSRSSVTERLQTGQPLVVWKETNKACCLSMLQVSA